MSTVRVAPLVGPALGSALGEVARLRIAVFRAWPYLYEGDLAYEERYLADFAAAPGAVIVAAFDAGRVIGAATGAPMAEQKPEWSAPFRARGEDLGEIFYCGESVLLPEYRGRGLGHAFFDHREARARDLGKRRAVFCAVTRDPADPRRPADYAPLDPFWRKRGYAPLQGVCAEFAWREIGAAAETAHRLQFWGRAL